MKHWQRKALTRNKLLLHKVWVQLNHTDVVSLLGIWLMARKHVHINVQLVTEAGGAERALKFSWTADHNILDFTLNFAVLVLHRGRCCCKCSTLSKPMPHCKQMCAIFLDCVWLLVWFGFLNFIQLFISTLASFYLVTRVGSTMPCCHLKKVSLSQTAPSGFANSR